MKKSIKWIVVTAVSSMLCLGLASGCGGDDGGEDDGSGGGAATGGGSGMGECSDADLAAMPQFFASSCGTTACHDKSAGSPSEATLDLVAPGVEARVKDVASPCEGKKYVDSANPEQSYLLEKLTHDDPTCGTRMPPGPALPAARLACVRAWVEQVAAQ